MQRAQQKRASGVLGVLPGLGGSSPSSSGEVTSGLATLGRTSSGTPSLPSPSRRNSVRLNFASGPQGFGGAGGSPSASSSASSASCSSPSSTSSRLSSRLSEILDVGEHEERQACLGFLEHLIMCISGREVSKDHLLESRLIGLYFSASWSPPCKIFTEQLSDWYNAIRAERGPFSFEVVLCPLDAEEDMWKDYIQNMPWLSLVHSYREQIIRLFLLFKVEAAPTLVVISNDGSTVMENARGNHGFGFGCDPLKVYDTLLNTVLAPKSPVGSRSILRMKQRSTLHAVEEEDQEEQDNS